MKYPYLLFTYRVGQKAFAMGFIQSPRAEHSWVVGRQKNFKICTSGEREKRAEVAHTYPPKLMYSY